MAERKVGGGGGGGGKDAVQAGYKLRSRHASLCTCNVER